MRIQSLVLLSSTLVLACSGEALDVGSDTPPTGSPAVPTVPSAPLPEWPGPGDCTFDPDLAVAGNWNGYVEGTDIEFRLSIISGGDDDLCGTVIFGEGPPPPPPTDPDAYYPGESLNKPGDLPAAGPWSGYAYTLLDGSTSGSRVRFVLSMTEGYKEWCAMQEPIASRHGYFCAPQGESWIEGDECFVINDLTNEEVTYPCDKFSLCMGNNACTCDETRCTATHDSPASGGLTFDFAVDGDEATGTVGGTVGDTVRLHRVE